MIWFTLYYVIGLILCLWFRVKQDDEMDTGDLGLILIISLVWPIFFLAPFMSKKDDYPEWTCRDCAIAAGGRYPEGHLATWHMGECPVCGETKPITQPRDYRYLDYKKKRKK